MFSYSVLITPLEMAIDFFMHDFEIAGLISMCRLLLYGPILLGIMELMLSLGMDSGCPEPPRVTSLKNVEPNPPFEEFGEDEYFIADSRGYECIVHGIAHEFLHSANGSISDPRLKLNKVFREIEYRNKGVKVSTEDSSVYTAKNAIVSVSVGVLETKLIDFKPDLPVGIFVCFTFQQGILASGKTHAPVGAVYFTGEHTSQEYNGYVHGAYLAEYNVEQENADGDGDGKDSMDG
ncbi:polyamine oxidase 6-like [Cryptomeria japonica]|uniref:polyamine oxidase 6-like n=1 Tax=Cryptomeria japonica TaxID=3369 RepID=UPI0027DA51ED|nr:polyamine oxidase 6-like [Cryptomeria japonica]